MHGNLGRAHLYIILGPLAAAHRLSRCQQTLDESTRLSVVMSCRHPAATFATTPPSYRYQMHGALCFLVFIVSVCRQNMK